MLDDTVIIASLTQRFFPSTLRLIFFVPAIYHADHWNQPFAYFLKEKWQSVLDHPSFPDFLLYISTHPADRKLTFFFSLDNRILVLFSNRCIPAKTTSC